MEAEGNMCVKPDMEHSFQGRFSFMQITFEPENLGKMLYFAADNHQYSVRVQTLATYLNVKNINNSFNQNN